MPIDDDADERTAAAAACTGCEAPAAPLACPRCRAPLCARCFAQTSLWCGACATSFETRLREVGSRRAVAVTLGGLGGGFSAGVAALLVCAALGWLMPGIPAVASLWLIMLATLGGTWGGARRGNRILDGREQARFFAEAQPTLPQARLVK